MLIYVTGNRFGSSKKIKKDDSHTGSAVFGTYASPYMVIGSLQSISPLGAYRYRYLLCTHDSGWPLLHAQMGNLGIAKC